MKSKHVRKVLSVCMALILLLSSTVSATGNVMLVGGSTSSASDLDSNTMGNTVFSVGEQVEMRGRYEKHFRLEDGSLVVAVYGEPVHYRDSSTGGWIEIDNTLESKTAANGTAVYRNHDGLFDVTFAQTSSLDNGQLVTVENGEHTISWQFATRSRGKTASETMRLTANDDASLAPVSVSTAQILSTVSNDEMAAPITGALIYSDLVGQGTDVRFTVTPTRVKEDILLDAAPAQAVSYTTRLTLSAGLMPILQEDGTVFIRDSEGDEVFRIVAPYMTDAADELSQQIAVELEQAAGAWELTVTPDLAWLQDEARVYPVTIDPTVTTSADNNAANVWDTYIYENSTATGGAARQDLDRMYIGNRTSTEKKCRGLLKFLTMPKIWGDITSATLTLSTPSGTTTWKDMVLYRNTSSWDCSTVAWPGPGATAIQTKAASNGQYVFNVTAAMKAMYYNNVGGTNGNYGFQIRYQNETVADYNAIRSSEWSDDTLISPSKPYLVINYTEYGTCSAVSSGGFYLIKNVASGKVLQVPGFGAAGTYATEGSSNALANQVWRLYHEGSGVYSITPAHNTNVRLNVPNFVSSDGKDINVWTDNNTTAERWYIRANGDGSFRFIPYCAKDDNRVLQIEDHNTKPTAEISVWNNVAKQKWYIQRICSEQSAEITDGGIYYLKNSASGKYLGLNSDNNANAVLVGHHTKSQSGTQRWKLTYNGRNYVLWPIIGHDGTFVLNKKLDVGGAAIAPGARLQMHTNTGSSAQEFQLRRLAANTYAILATCTGYANAISANSSDNYVVTAAYSSTDTKQQWILEPADNNSLEAVSIGGEFFVEATDSPEQYADIKLSQRAFDLLGYATERYETPDFDTIYTKPDLASVVHFSCHGGADGLQFINAPGRNSGSVVNVTIDYYDANTSMRIDQYVTDNCKLMIFDACSTYLPGADNDICDAAVAAGVDAVLAWGQPVQVDNLAWFEDFYDHLLRGKTINEAVNLMNGIHIKRENCSCGDGNCSMYDARIVGNGNVRLYAQS